MIESVTSQCEFPLDCSSGHNSCPQYNQLFTFIITLIWKTSVVIEYTVLLKSPSPVDFLYGKYIFLPYACWHRLLPPTITMFHFNGMECVYCCLYQAFLQPLFNGFMSSLLMNPNIRRVKIIGESASDKQRMKIFSILALSKHWSKVVEASRFAVVLAVMLVMIFIGIKALWLNWSIILSFEGTPHHLVLNMGLVLSR